MELNPCYDITMQFSDNNLSYDWAHQERAFAYGIGKMPIKNII